MDFYTMPKNIPSLKPKELVRILKAGGCAYLMEGIEGIRTKNEDLP